MSRPAEADVRPSDVSRRPEQLLLAFLGELVVGRDLGPVPTALLVDVLGGLGASEPATRAALSRMVRRGLLRTVRSGRAVGYLLTPTSERVLDDARGRIFAADPFAPEGTGWTLVTFSVPETRRDVRHRVRAQLTWAGFGLLRDGLWIAPGEVDLADVLGEFAASPDVDLAAFRAREVEGFPVGRAVRAAWPLEEFRARHRAFQERWATAPPDGADPVQEVTALVADWLALLRAVPRLPVEHLGDGWPSSASVHLFHERHRHLAPAARAALDERLGR